MSLTKSFTLANDIEVSYWRLRTVQFELSDERVIFNYDGYISEDSYNNNKDSIISKSIELSLSEFSDIKDELNNYSYDALSDLLDSQNGA